MSFRKYEKKIEFVGKTPKLYKTVRIKKNIKERYFGQVEYDFLQYIRVVNRWARDNYDLKQGEVDLLLYLHAKGVFGKSEFYKYHKLIGMYQIKTLQKFMKTGFLQIWRKGVRGKPQLYTLSNKAKAMCTKMYRFLLGDEEIPVTKKLNKMVNMTSEIRNRNYYMDVIKEMNKDRKK